MDKLKVLLILVLLILVAFALSSVINKRGKKNVQNEPIPQMVSNENTVAAQMPVVNEPVQTKPSLPVTEKQETTPVVKIHRPFWGNRGYLIKNGKSTFIRASELERLKKEYEEEVKK